MQDQSLSGLEFAADTRLVNFDLGPAGLLKLDTIRPSVLRAGRLAAALFAALEADMIAVQRGRVWRGKGAVDHSDDASAELIARHANAPYWVADTALDPEWKDHRSVRGGPRIRFCAAGPVRLRSGECLGALRVFDVRPRPFDAALADRLQDLADTIADEADRLLHGEASRLRDLFDQAPGFMAVLTGPDHVFEFANRAYMDLVGDRPVLGLSVAQALPEVAHQGFETLLDGVWGTGQPHVARAAPISLRSKPGADVLTSYIDFVYQPIRTPDGHVSGIFVQGHDVTRQKHAADELEASRLALESALSAKQTIFDHSLDIICTIDAAGHFTKVSRHAEEVWGYSSKELLGRAYIDFVHPDDVEATTAIAAEIMAGSPTKGFTNRYMHRDGTAVRIMWSATWSAKHQMFFAVARDLREHEAAEEKLRQAQKMEAVGLLTGGIAHDFNNLLTVVIGSAEMLSEAVRDQPDVEPLTHLVLEAAERGADLVSRLMAFSRQQALVPQTVNCRALFKSLSPLLQRTIGSNIQIEVSAPEDLNCLADPTQLTSALLNLSINARDAMPEGGRLSISARLEPPLDTHDVSSPASASLVSFTVRDTGEGMSAETVKRVLEPFFTTKAVGKGSGLGLSMVYGFATQSGGRLEIDSELGAGTSVCLYLPWTAHPGEATISEPEEVVRPTIAKHILLVEDDNLLRRQVERQLTGLGYRVTARADGPSALTRLSEAPDIDLLMTDIVMPGGLNGRQLAVRANDLVPGLRTLFTSGFSDHASLSSDLVDRADFLPKPYRRADLAQRLKVAFGDE